MLKAIVNLLQKKKAPLSLDGLSQRLDVDKRAMEGILDPLVQKGIIANDQSTAVDNVFRCG